MPVERLGFHEQIAHGQVDPDSEPGKAHAEFRIAFDDDGIYPLKITVSNRPPPQ